MVSLFLTVSCRKDKSPEPSNFDKNYFVIEDNPNDPTDHAIYSFYKNTGIACFYNDSIYKKRVSREDEIPARYSYIKLSLNYHPFGNSSVSSKLLTSKNNIQPLLTLMEEAVIPKLPSPEIIPSILLLDSFADHEIMDIQLSHGLSTIYGFNTVGLKVEEVAMMNEEEIKIYAASILAGIAFKKTADLFGSRLQKDFFSISREAARGLIAVDVYSGYPWLFVIPPGSEPIPKNIGFLFYPTYNFPLAAYPNMPREADDIRGFLTAIFRYTEQEFADLHPNETLVQKKFSILRNIVKEAGFKIPD